MKLWLYIHIFHPCCWNRLLTKRKSDSLHVNHFATICRQATTAGANLLISNLTGFSERCYLPALHKDEAKERTFQPAFYLIHTTTFCFFPQCRKNYHGTKKNYPRDKKFFHGDNLKYHGDISCVQEYRPCRDVTCHVSHTHNSRYPKHNWQSSRRDVSRLYTGGFLVRRLWLCAEFALIGFLREHSAQA